MSRRRRGFASILALGLLLALQAPTSSAPKRPEVKDWEEGPVRYILKRDEIKFFRALDDDEGRLRFIDQFWLRRDPTPGTTENEFRNLFWTRVKFANERYADGAAPGWKSDRGKLFVLCGEPDKIETMPNANTQSGPTAGHGLIRWTYERRPCGRSDLGPIVIVAFVREVTGEYRLSTDPKLSSLYFRQSDLTDPTVLKVEKWLDQVGIPDRSELSVMADLGTLQEGPHPEERIVERVETSEAYGSRPLQVQMARFRHPRGGTLVVLTMEAPVSSDDTTPSFVARLVPRDLTRTKRFLGEESFRLEGTGRTGWPRPGSCSIRGSGTSRSSRWKPAYRRAGSSATPWRSGLRFIRWP